jgi:hypothetical protein
MSPALVSVELNTMNAASGSTKKLNSIPGLILPIPAKINYHAFNKPDDNKLINKSLRLYIVNFALCCVRFEVFTAVTTKNGVFWNVTQCGSCKNRRFGGTWRHLHQGDKNR